MSSRRIETIYAWATLAFATIYAPVETVVSWPHGLANPYYLVDVIAIGLMLVGAIRSLRSRPRSAPALLTVGWAWAGANFWRATLARAEHLQEGGTLNFGAIEMQLAVGSTVLALMCLGVGTWLIIREH